MGTRADFYVKTKEGMEWLGSVGWDGYEWYEDKDSCLMKAKTEDEFRKVVKDIEKTRDDFTKPEEGWPWPWKDSNTTDYAYVFDLDKVVVPRKKVDWFPDMTRIKNVKLGGKSGLVFIRGS